MLAFEESTHTYTVAGDVVPSVTQIIKWGGEGADYSNVPEHILKRAGDIGTEVHEVIEGYHRHYKPLISTDKSATQYLSGYGNFLRSGVFECLHSEKKLYCPDLWFAGTVDLVGIVNGKLSVLDIKTTSRLHHGPAELQLAAYDYLVRINLSLIPESRYIVHLKKNGSFSLEDMYSVSAWAEFKGLVERYHRERV